MLTPAKRSLTLPVQYSVFKTLRGIRIYSALLLLFVCILFSCTKKLSDQPSAHKGIIDLKTINFLTTTADLDGEWEFYYNRMVWPSEIITQKNYSPFPQLWSKTLVNGKALPSFGYASYKLDVLLPGDKPVLAFEMPDVYTSYRLYVNGRIFSQNGIADTSQKETRPQWRNMIVPIPPHLGDTLHILLQVSNFAHNKGGVYKSIVIGDRQKIFLERDRRLTGDFLLSGCLFMGGLFFLGLYMFGRHDKAIFYFALFCISYCYRIVGTSPYSLHSVLPDIDWYITLRLEYISLGLSVFFFVNYIKYLYPDDIYKPVFPVMSGFSLLFTFFALCFSPAFFTSIINYFLGIMFLYIGYAIYIFIRAAANKRMGANYALLSTGVIMLVFVIINLNYLKIVEFSYHVAVFIGYIFFFFFQSMILSFRFANTLKLAKQQAEQGLRVKSEFLSTMSHEIRTPLNSVIGTANLMLQSNPTETQKEYLDVLIFSANNLVSIVNDILDYNKIEAGKISFESIEMDLTSIAKNIAAGARTSASDRGIELKLEIDKNLKHKVFGDPTRTSQVIYNLVNNAIKFTNEGWVCLRIKVIEQNEATATVLFEVEDTGIGIEPQKQKIIFEKFTQADSSTSRGYGGTGLGLAICKRLLELQDSSLKLRSLSGVGSVFSFVQTFSLGGEIITDQQKAMVAKTVVSSNDLKGVQVLLVEDNPMNVFIAKKMLNHWKADIDIAENGKLAVEKAACGAYDIILMDLHMPVMDGYDASRNIRKSGNKIPIVALTAAIPSEVKEKVFEVGMNDILIKPFSSNELLNMVLREVDKAVNIKEG